MIPLANLRLQYKQIKKEVNVAIAKVLENANFILGEEVGKFEKEFASYIGVKYAVGLDSGMSALELGIRAMGIEKGDEILTPTNSFIASSSAISFAGATPVLVDCDPTNFNIDLHDAERKITKKTKAIMPVHLYGQSVDMEKIISLAKKYSLKIIEDACQAHGAFCNKKRVGSFGDIAAFSFYPGKNLGAYGDGGILVTNNRKIHLTIMAMRNYGQKEKYNHVFLAWNKRLDTLQAAVLRVKLKYLDSWNRKRRENAFLYTKLLKDIVITPSEQSGMGHVYHQYVVRVKRRNKLKDFLLSKGIDVGIHYPIPIHLQPAYRNLGHNRGDFPIAEKYSEEILSLPMHPELTSGQIRFIVNEIRKFYR